MFLSIFSSTHSELNPTSGGILNIQKVHHYICQLSKREAPHLDVSLLVL